MGGSSVFGKGGAPEAPDFAGAAREQTKLNRPDQFGPFGSTVWNGNTQTTSLAGGLGQGAESLMGQIGAQGPLGTGDDARNQAIDSAYTQASSRLDPQWGQREESTRAMLANQGLDPGSEAYGNEMGNFSRGRNDAYSSAMANAIGQGTAAGNSVFQNNLAGQMAPYQQLGALQGLSRPGAYGSAGDLLGALGNQYQGELNAYGIEQGGKNSMLGGLASLGGTLGAASIMGPAAAPLAASDERLKTHVERSMLEALPGVPFASWEWKDAPGERHYGVIAQDLEKVRPDLVHYRDDGMRLVDYGGLMNGGMR
jgi:hypothetical protein